MDSPRSRSARSSCICRSTRASRRASTRSVRQERCLPSRRRSNTPSCPALCRASTTFLQEDKPWMAGTSPAMTKNEEGKRMSDDTHEIYAIKYGRHERKKAENYIGGDPHDAPEPIDYYVWAITGPSGTFVVDTGFDAAMAKKRGRVISKPIAEGLKAIDIAPDSVKNVIISHLHYDHCGNYDTFPNARFHLQDTEMAYATGRCMCHKHLRVPFEEEDVVAMVRKVFAGRVTFNDGASQDAPGIILRTID